jgi:nitronate monooxygenase
VRPLPFPAQLSLTRPLQEAAAAAGDAEMMFLLAGQGAALARDLPAGELVETLVAETENVVSSFGGNPSG